MDRELRETVERDAQALEERTLGSRRNFLRNGAFVAAGGAGLLLASCTDDGNGAVAQGEGSQQGASLFDRIRDGDRVRVGADLTFPPLQMKEGNEPTGYTIDLARMMFEDLNPDVEIEWVEITFGELFGSLAAGRFDISGIGATNLPSRSQQVLFAGEPLFIENSVILRNEDSNVRSLEDLNSPDTRIAVLAGSAQESSARAFFPEAELRSLEQQPAIQDAATGRSDAVLVGEFGVVGALDENPSLEVLDIPPVFASINTYFMAPGDFKMWAYVTNWLKFQIIKGTLAERWETLVAGPVRERGVQSTPVMSPYLAAGQVLGGTIRG